MMFSGNILTQSPVTMQMFNSAFLTASKLAQGPFLTPAQGPIMSPALGKNSSIIIPKAVPGTISLSSGAKPQSLKKEEILNSDSSSQIRPLSAFKVNPASKTDEKIPIPSVSGDGVIYVSAKRYKRILIRRRKRKAEKKSV